MNKHYGKSNSPRAKAARIRQRLSDGSLVSEEETDLKLVRELRMLSANSKATAKEVIRVLYLMEQGHEKRRLLSDAPTGQQSDMPGELRIADLLMQAEKNFKRISDRGRKARQRLREDYLKEVKHCVQVMDSVEGVNDPERIIERIIEGSALRHDSSQREGIGGKLGQAL